MEKPETLATFDTQDTRRRQAPQKYQASKHRQKQTPPKKSYNSAAHAKATQTKVSIIATKMIRSS
jgi:hypothetical protein